MTTIRDAQAGQIHLPIFAWTPTAGLDAVVQSLNCDIICSMLNSIFDQAWSYPLPIDGIPLYSRIGYLRYLYLLFPLLARYPNISNQSQPKIACFLKHALLKNFPFSSGISPLWLWSGNRDTSTCTWPSIERENEVKNTIKFVVFLEIVRQTQTHVSSENPNSCWSHALKWNRAIHFMLEGAPRVLRKAVPALWFATRAGGRNQRIWREIVDRYTFRL